MGDPQQDINMDTVSTDGLDAVFDVPLQAVSNDATSTVQVHILHRGVTEQAGCNDTTSTPQEGSNDPTNALHADSNQGGGTVHLQKVLEGVTEQAGYIHPDITPQEGSNDPTDTVQTNFNPDAIPSDEGLTLKEAMQFYKLSGNSVRMKIKLHEIPAQKIDGPNGPEWRIYPKGLPKTEQHYHKPTSSHQVQFHDGMATVEVESFDDTTSTLQVGSNDPTSTLQSIADDSTNTVQVELNDDSQQGTTNHSADVNQLTALLEVLKEKDKQIEGATYRIGYLEAQLQNEREQIKLLTDSQHKKGPWKKFYEWMIGKNQDPPVAQ